MAIKTVFLDWDGTLCKGRFWGHWKKGERAEAYAQIQADFFKGNKNFLTCWMRGEETAESAAAVVAALTNIEFTMVLAELEKSCQEMRFVSERIPALVTSLRAQGVRVIIATDNMDTFSRWTVPALKLDKLFDDILDSHTLKYLKQDVGLSGKSVFFEACMRELDVNPAECLLVDDSPSAQKVENFGMKFMAVTQEHTIVEILTSLQAELC